LNSVSLVHGRNELRVPLNMAVTLQVL